MISYNPADWAKTRALALLAVTLVPGALGAACGSEPGKNKGPNAPYSPGGGGGDSSLSDSGAGGETLRNQAGTPFQAGEGGTGAAGGASGAASDGGEPATILCEPSGREPVIKMDAITTDTTWTAEDGPYLIPYLFSAGLQVKAKLTLEPCAEVLLEGGAIVAVQGKDGRLEALGTPERPISMRAEDPTLPFTSIVAINGGTIALSHVGIEAGGKVGGNNPATLDLHAQGSERVIALLDHVSITDSATAGLVLRDKALLDPASDALTISGSQGYPVILGPEAVTALPAGDYTGNRDDLIQVETGTAFDVTFHELGVPYQAAELKLDGTLTLEAGVELRMMKNARLQLNDGSIQAIGSEEKPIILTSASAGPAPGDWPGLRFEGDTDPTSVMQYVHVDYAGGFSGATYYNCASTPGNTSANAAILFINTAPQASFIKNCSISHSAGYGIGRAWTGAETDFAEGNEFSDIAWCVQSYPKPLIGYCKEPAPCELAP